MMNTIRINTRTVSDIGTGEVLYREYFWYDGPIAECKKPKRSPLEGTATSVAAQDQAVKTADYSTAQGTNAQFEGPVDKSPFYKALERTGIESTSNAYQGARANMRARANATGFGGSNQPIVAGAESQMDVAEGRDLAAVPGKALTAAAPLSLEASKQTADMGTASGAQGVGYFGEGVGLEKQYQDQVFQQQQAMWNALSQIPQDLAAFAKPKV